MEDVPSDRDGASTLALIFAASGRRQDVRWRCQKKPKQGRKRGLAHGGDGERSRFWGSGRSPEISSHDARLGITCGFIEVYDPLRVFWGLWEV